MNSTVYHLTSENNIDKVVCSTKKDWDKYLLGTCKGLILFPCVKSLRYHSKGFNNVVYLKVSYIKEDIKEDGIYYSS